MFRKLFLILTLLIFVPSMCFAGIVNKTIIAETQLDDNPTSVTSSTFNIQDYDKVAFFIKYDETEVGNSISIAVTFDTSYNGSDWVDASFHDYAGGATLQTSETISSDGWYYCWFDPDLSIRYVRAVITATNSDTDDLATVTAYMIGTR